MKEEILIYIISVSASITLELFCYIDINIEQSASNTNFINLENFALADVFRKV